MLGTPGVKDACREVLEEGRTRVSLASDNSRRRLRKDKNRAAGTSAGSQTPLSGESLLMAQSVGVTFA